MWALGKPPVKGVRSGHSAGSVPTCKEGASCAHPPAVPTETPAKIQPELPLGVQDLALVPALTPGLSRGDVMGRVTTTGGTTGGTAPAVGSQHSATGSRVGWWEPHAPVKNCKSSTTARMVFEKKLSWGFAEHKHHPVWFVTVAAAEPKIDRCPQRITGGAELWLLTRISNRPPGP